MVFLFYLSASAMLRMHAEGPLDGHQGRAQMRKISQSGFQMGPAQQAECNGSVNASDYQQRGQSTCAGLAAYRSAAAERPLLAETRPKLVTANDPKRSFKKLFTYPLVH